VPPYDAGSTTLVEDINTTPDPSESSDLEELVNVSGTLYFSANNGVNGQELWKSVFPYGANETTLVKDINTTPGISANSFPAGFEIRGGEVFFNADDGVSGQELWKTNGTEPGTTMVLDINPAPGGSNPDGITNVDGTLFFSALGPIEGRELWKSDGSGPGTAVVADINPTVSSSSPQEITNLNGTLFFRASDGTSGNELWKSNGGPLGAGTEMVADINPGGSTSSSIPAELTEVGGQLFFRAVQGAINENELWKTAGSGATMVADINETPATGSLPSELTNVNGTLFFRANDGIIGRELWKATIEPFPPAAGGQPAIGPAPQKAKKKCKKKSKKSAASAKKKRCKKKKRK
jgi:ELWxxDGT repeat protein